MLAWDEMAAHDGHLGESTGTARAQRYEKVSDLISSEREQRLVHIRLDNGETLTATEGHPLRTQEGWRDAILLKKGGKLLLRGSEEDPDADSDGKPQRTATIEAVHTEVTTVQVFNLEVENLHTFFVGEEGVVVHNARSRGGQSGAGRGDAHGNTSKAERSKEKVAKYNEMIKNCGSKRERIKLEQKARNVKKTADKAKKGETHGLKGF